MIDGVAVVAKNWWIANKAREQLAPLRATRTAGDIRLVYGDGQRGHPPNAPYEGIIAAAGGEHLPAPWLEQLAVGGRLVAPLQRSGHRRGWLT